MTSRTDLPYIPTGIIWDGVTEYHQWPAAGTGPCVDTADGW